MVETTNKLSLYRCIAPKNRLEHKYGDQSNLIYQVQLTIITNFVLAVIFTVTLTVIFKQLLIY